MQLLNWFLSFWYVESLYHDMFECNFWINTLLCKMCYIDQNIFKI